MRVGGQQQYAGQKSFCSLATFLRNHRGNMQSHLEFSNGRTKEPQMEEREREREENICPCCHQRKSRYQIYAHIGSYS